MTYKLISDRIAAVAAGSEFEIDASHETTGLPITIVANNLAGAEEVDLYISVDSGTTWITLVDSVGNAVKLTATVPMRTLYAPALYGVLKDATAGACGVYVFQRAFK